MFVQSVCAGRLRSEDLFALHADSIASPDGMRSAGRADRAAIPV